MTFGVIERIFIGLLTGLPNVCIHTKCVSSSNQKCMTQPSLIVQSRNTLLSTYD